MCFLLFFLVPILSFSAVEADHALDAMANSGKPGVIFQLIVLGMSDEERQEFSSAVEAGLKEQGSVREDMMVSFILNQGVSYCSEDYVQHVNAEYAHDCCRLKLRSIYIFPEKWSEGTKSAVYVLYYHIDQAERVRKGQPDYFAGMLNPDGTSLSTPQTMRARFESPICIMHKSSEGVEGTLKVLKRIRTEYPLSVDEHPWAFQYTTLSLCAEGRVMPEFKGYS